jgi:TolB-like protein/tetratricopeptide (TPR) repeat protein
MTILAPARWADVEPLFEEALTLPSAERSAFVERRTTNPEVRRHLKRLLAAHARADGFLERLNPGLVADLLDDALPIEPVIGRYQVLRRLGHGGMGVVYLARDPQLGRAVALKLLPAVLGADARARQRFADEARAASALDHPHIGTIYEINETPDGRPYIAMAYYEGGTLAQRVRAGSLPVPDAVRLATQIADALAASHERGIVHCDVKPGNVVLTPAGAAKVVDFGVARMLGAGGADRGAQGTPAYMSPEQFRGQIDARCDVWSFGVMLYEMLAGRRPYRSIDATAVHAEIAANDCVPLGTLRPEVPAPLAALVSECLQVDPALRPADGRALLDSLRALDAPMVTVSRSRSRRLTTLALVSAVVILTSVVGGTMWLRSRAAAEASAGDPSTIAVMPFISIGGDTALARLGRELVLTVSAGLTGTGSLRAVEPTTVLARITDADSAQSLERATTLATAWGAGRVVHGTLMRVGEGVRLDLGVFATETAAALERFVVSVPTDDIAALSDSVTLAMLRGSWSGLGVVPPSSGALRTASVPALRAYLEGERALARGRLRLAPQHFAQAVALDSTFWFARWRHAYSLNSHGESADSSVLASLFAHRGELPDADRLLIEAWFTGEVDEGLERRRSITRQFPDYWPGWFELGNVLLHSAPYLGHSIAESRAAFERLTELNPSFVPAWEHLMWVGLGQPDTALAARALARLERVGLDSIAARESGLQTLEFYRYLVQLRLTNDTPDPAFTRIGVRDLADQPGSMAPERFAADLAGHGFYRAQLALSRDLRATNAPANVRGAHAWAEAVALAGLGDWNAAVAAAAAFARESAEPRAALWGYGLCVIGAWLGELSPDEIGPLRELAARSAAARPASGAAELAWLDGIVAVARRDSPALAAQRTTLERSDAGAASELARALRAFELALDGSPNVAADTLASLEMEMARGGWIFRWAGDHPFANAIHRTAAGRWLLARGDSAAAARLQRWHEAVLPGRLYPVQEVNRLIADAVLR